MTATVISPDSGTIDGDNTAGTLEIGEAACLGYETGGSLGYGGGASVWYSFTPTVTDTYRFSTDDGPGEFKLRDSLLTVIDSDNFGTASVLGQDDDSGPGGYSQVDVVLTGGTTYWIAVDGYNGYPTDDIGYDPNNTAQGSFTLTWGPVPVCDAGPAVLSNTLIQTYPYGALFEIEVCPDPVSPRNVWLHYGVTTAYGGLTDVVTIPPGTEPVTCRLLVPACGETDNLGGFMSPSSNYHARASFQSSGFDAAPDVPFTTAAATVPVNDDIANATLLTGLSGSIDGDNSFATLEAGEGDLLYEVDNSLYGDGPYGGGRSVWFKWTAPADMNVAFWTTPADDSNDGPNSVGFNGLCDSLVNVLNGDDFGTATVITADEYTQSRIDVQPRLTLGFGGTRYPWSTVQFGAQSGQTYWIAVDGYNGDRPSEGGYDINNTFVGPFRLWWGAPVDAEPVARNCTFISATANSVTLQFEVNPQSTTGTAWASARLFASPFTSYNSAHNPATGFNWITVTRTIYGLPSNTQWDVVRGHVGNPVVPGGDFTDCADFCTAMPLDASFGICMDLLEDFTGINCTNIGGPSVEQGLHIRDNMGAAYEGDVTENHRSSFSVSMPSGTCGGIDFSLDLVTLHKQIELGVAADGATSAYFARVDSDVGTLELYAEPGGTLATTSVPFVDGDKLGIRLTNDAFIAYRSNDGGTTWTEELSVTGLGLSLTGFSAGAIIGMKVTLFPLDFGDCMPTLDDMGLVTYQEPCCDLCPIGIPKYQWLNHSWIWAWPTTPKPCAEAAPADYDHCPFWYAYFTIYPHGRFDCYNTVWNLGNGCGIDESAHNYCGWLITEPTWTAVMNDIDGDHSFFVFDGNYANKIYAKLVAARAALLACDPEASEYEGSTSEPAYGGGNYVGAWQVLRPVDVAPGRVDNLMVGYANCQLPQVVSFSHVRFPRRADAIALH